MWSNFWYKLRNNETLLTTIVAVLVIIICVVISITATTIKSNHLKADYEKMISEIDVEKHGDISEDWDIQDSYDNDKISMRVMVNKNTGFTYAYNWVYDEESLYPEVMLTVIDPEGKVVLEKEYWEEDEIVKFDSILDDDSVKDTSSDDATLPLIKPNLWNQNEGFSVFDKEIPTDGSNE